MLSRAGKADPMDHRIHLKKTGGKKIHVDPGDTEGFFLYPGEIRKSGLKDDMILQDEELEAIRQEYAVPRARRRALGLLARKDMTASELREKLESSLNDSRSVAQVMDFVTGRRYIDDEAYVRDYVSSHRTRKSFRQIRQILLRKGIDEDLLQQVMEGEEDQTPEDIRRQVEKYARKFPDLDYPSEQKILAHFARKGYSVHTVRSVLRDLEDS